VASKRGEKSFLVKALKVLRAIFLEGHPSLPLDTAWKMKESVDFSAINIPISNVFIYEGSFNVECRRKLFFLALKRIPRLSVLKIILGCLLGLSIHSSVHLYYIL
jgi:hypothetical protein